MTPRRSLCAGELVYFCVGLVVLGVVVPTLLDTVASFSTAVRAQMALRTIWAVLFIVAGNLRLVRWRLTGEARAGWLAAGMLCFGVLTAPTAALAPLLQHDARDIWLSPVTRVLAVAVFQATLARVFLSPTVNARVRPLRYITRMLLLSAGVLALFVTAQNLVAPVTLPAHVWFVVGAVQTGMWLAYAIAALVAGQQRQDASMVWIGLGLLLLGSAEFLRAVAFISLPASAFYATCLQVVVGAIAVANAAVDLSLVLSADGNRLLSLTGALRDAESMLTEEERARAERLHDARSVIAALKAASITLDRYDERLDTDMKHRLRSSLVSELARLEQVIDGRRQEPLRAFRLRSALTPLLVAERENGLSIEEDLLDIAVVGRPLELATVVQNLLVNARRYAPGSAVRVAATTMHGHVRLVVEDRGPGIDPTQQELIFERGHRCDADTDGSGLGLFLARRLMREQGGEIVVRDRVAGGASFLMTLPAPSWNQKIDDGAEIIHSRNRQVDVSARHGDAPSLADSPRQRDDDTTLSGRSGAVGHDEVNQQPLVGRPDLQTT